ncbi:MAG TPA: GNAT family N-acetyltransferase [Usitatibacter sp.]|nr:GNAT family N-acetyltransferase [Usitatibacter sp.]
MSGDPPFQPVTLESSRLKLRFIVAGDAPGLFAIYGDPVVARYLSRPAFTQMAQAEKLVATANACYADGSGVNFAVERRDDAAMIGTCMLFRFHRESRRAEIGYSLGQAYWGQGYMHEALQALIDYAFGPLGLNRIEADIDPRNSNSARSLERLGFRMEGVLRERWIVAGEVSDTGYYGLLRKEWSYAHG